MGENSTTLGDQVGSPRVVPNSLFPSPNPFCLLFSRGFLLIGPLHAPFPHHLRHHKCRRLKTCVPESPLTGFHASRVTYHNLSHTCRLARARSLHACRSRFILTFCKRVSMHVSLTQRDAKYQLSLVPHYPSHICLYMMQTHPKFPLLRLPLKRPQFLGALSI